MFLSAILSLVKRIFAVRFATCIQNSYVFALHFYALSYVLSCILSFSIIHVSASNHNWTFYGMQSIDTCQAGRHDKTEGRSPPSLSGICALMSDFIRPDSHICRRHVDSCPSVSPRLRFAACRIFNFSADSFYCHFVYTAFTLIPFALNRLLYAVNFFVGTFTTAFAYVPPNACAPTFLLVSESVLIVMERSFLQL